MPCNPTVTSVRGDSTLPVAMVNAIVRLHNEARYNATPSAVTMPPLQWSEELAIGAQEYLDSCPGFRHSPQTQRRDRYGFAYIGENLAAGMRFEFGGFERACNMWIEERDAWTYDGATCTGSSVCGTCTPSGSITACGHYTQVVWSTTTHVGCGYAKCASDSIPIYNCWYGPGGNIVRKGPYVEGTRDPTQTCPPASGSTTGPSTTSPGAATAAATTTAPPGAPTTTAAPPPTPTPSSPGPGGNPAAPDESGSNGPSGGVVAAAVIGSLVAVGAIVALVFVVMRRPAKSGSSDVQEMMLADEKGGMAAAPPSAPMLTDDLPVRQGNRVRTITGFSSL
uniref:SCP domain-containing protein n=1 Tax=Neobodo designis TaxID=312471 RepID=A0A7S1W906_NEODS